MRISLLASPVLAVLLLLSSCSTLVRIETNVPDAKVKFDNRTIGTTPITRSVSDAVWENPDVIIEKDGYKTLHVKLVKEVKVGAGVGGILFWPIWFWAWGPQSYQYFELDPQN